MSQKTHGKCGNSGESRVLDFSRFIALGEITIFRSNKSSAALGRDNGSRKKQDESSNALRCRSYIYTIYSLS